MTSKRQSITAPDLQFNDPKLNRLMQFVRDQARELQALQQMLRAGSAGQALLKSTSADYDATWGSSGGGGTLTGAENVGDGAGVFKDVEGTLLAFKSLIEGDNITLTVSGNSITISSTASGGGTGTVTSVGIDSDVLDVSGSPVTTNGSITLKLKPNAVTYDGIQQTSTDSVVLGRRFGDGAGDIEELGPSDLEVLMGATGGYPKQLAYAGIV